MNVILFMDQSDAIAPRFVIFVNYIKHIMLIRAVTLLYFAPIRKRCYEMEYTDIRAMQLLINSV